MIAIIMFLQHILHITYLYYIYYLLFILLFLSSWRQTNYIFLKYIPDSKENDKGEEAEEVNLSMRINIATFQWPQIWHKLLPFTKLPN